MPRITLRNNLAHPVNQIHTMTARPMNVVLTGLGGGGAVVTCTNPLPAIQGAKSVDITYNNPANPLHQTDQVSSVQP